MTNKLILAPEKLKLTSKGMGLIIISLAIVAVSFAAIFIRLSENEIGPSATIFNRLWIATLTLVWWRRLTAIIKPEQPKITPNYTSSDILLLVMVGIVSSTSVVFWAWSLTQTSVANSTLIRNLTPIFTTIGTWLLYRQKISSRFLLGLIIAIMGAIALGYEDLEIATQNLLGDGIALLSAMLYAINLLLVERLRRKLTSKTILLWRCVIGVLLLLPIVLTTETNLFPSAWQGWLAVIGLGVICQVLGQGLLIYSLQLFSSGFVAMFLLLEPILTAFFAWIFLAESLNLLNGLAFVLVLSGIYLAQSDRSIIKK